ncbi:MAG: hypothetical protein J6I80_01325 [Clostridia bacterium]|nr:hypothetical protein [Clostridia bacterium]
MKNSKHKTSKIVKMHYVKLVFRSLLFILAATVYLVNRIHDKSFSINDIHYGKPAIFVIWAVFIIEMILRFFPAKVESMGCQKQFARNYRPIKTSDKPKNQSGWRTFSVAAAWIGLNSVIALLYFLKIFDTGILLLISLAFSICDVICILFFCPFQTWFMKNKCCGTCRIYNWDYAMMFTPLIFINNFYTLSLVAVALALLIKWEILVHRRKERFCENTNLSLSCGLCEEKLCHHKKQLQTFLQNGKFNLKGNAFIKSLKEKLKQD